MILNIEKLYMLSCPLIGCRCLEHYHSISFHRCFQWPNASAIQQSHWVSNYFIQHCNIGMHVVMAAPSRSRFFCCQSLSWRRHHSLYKNDILPKIAFYINFAFHLLLYYHWQQFDDCKTILQSITVVSIRQSKCKNPIYSWAISWVGICHVKPWVTKSKATSDLAIMCATNVCDTYFIEWMWSY